MMIEKQVMHIGVLAEDGGENWNRNVFINKNSNIQYLVKPLEISANMDNTYTGYISSFDDNRIKEDEYSADESRIEKFTDLVKDQLFLFYERPSSGTNDHQKLYTADLIDAPAGFDQNTKYYKIPTFAPAKDKMVKEWEEVKKWSFFRNYNTLEEFRSCIKDNKHVGSIYGYGLPSFSPSFVIWKDTNGSLYAIGTINEYSYDTTGKLVIEGDKLFKIDLSDYLKSIVYHPEINPAITFAPEKIYITIENELKKAAVTAERTETISILDKEEETLNNKENVVETEHDTEESIVEIKEISDEKLCEINSSVKNDNLIIDTLEYNCQNRKLFFNTIDFVNFHTAVKCSDLVILSGLSGTGKSALVEQYAKTMGMNITNPEDNGFLIVPVRPSWNDDSDLLGYVDLIHMVYRPSDNGFVDLLVKAQKDENENKMFLVCFDEMNLARVEHYFSQFLSILERNDKSRELQLYDKQYTGRLYNSTSYPNHIKIKENIRFIGTVNVDETTYHFSDKVLDRANVIELDIMDYSKGWVKKNYATLPQIVWSREEYIKLKKNGDNVSVNSINDITAMLWEIHKLLQSASTKYGIGPRVVKAVNTYLINLPEFGYSGFDISVGLDYQIKQRILTKVRGPESQLGKILNIENCDNIISIFDKYSYLSKFDKCRASIIQKQKELSTYGYCV